MIGGALFCVATTAAVRWDLSIAFGFAAPLNGREVVFAPAYAGTCTLSFTVRYDSLKILSDDPPFEARDEFPHFGSASCF